MKKNDEFELTITDISVDGAGIGKANSLTFFVKDTVPGDKILAHVTKMKKNYGFAKCMKVLEPSPDRVDPVCPISKQCGGCSLQQLSYEKQLEFKRNKVKNNLIRIGGFSQEEMEALVENTVGMESPYRYRNKAQFPIGKDGDGNLVAGFFASRTHYLIPTEDCYLGAEENKDILQLVLQWMQEEHIEPYDEKNHTGLVRHVLIRKGFHTGEWMVCLIVNAKTLSNGKTTSFVEKLKDFPGMKSISYNVNTEKTNVILGKETVTIWGNPVISDYIGDLRFEISPQSFYQVNAEQTEKLYGAALDFADLHGQETVWDLYCGIGTISLFLAKKAKKVYGVEIVPQAIEDAKKNAKNNGIDNVEFFVGKSEEVYPEYVKQHPQEGRAEVIVVDPPRKGCEEALLSMMCEMTPEKIVYVSCDSATLARDLKFLCENGYSLKKVRPVDMFGNTNHVETVVLLTRVN